METLDQEQVRRAIVATRDEITDADFEALRTAAAAYLVIETALQSGIAALRTYAERNGIEVAPLS